MLDESRGQVGAALSTAEKTRQQLHDEERAFESLTQEHLTFKKVLH